MLRLRLGSELFFCHGLSGLEWREWLNRERVASLGFGDTR